MKECFGCRTRFKHTNSCSAVNYHSLDSRWTAARSSKQSTRSDLAPVLIELILDRAGDMIDFHVEKSHPDHHFEFVMPNTM